MYSQSIEKIMETIATQNQEEKEEYIAVEISTQGQEEKADQ